MIAPIRIAYVDFFPFPPVLFSAQLPGLPEICKKSLSESPAAGERDLFIVGKNFMKGTRVIFSQPGADGTILWEKNAEIDLEYFQQVKQTERVFLFLHLHNFDKFYSTFYFVSPTYLSLSVFRGFTPIVSYLVLVRLVFFIACVPKYFFYYQVVVVYLFLNKYVGAVVPRLIHPI